VKNGVLVEVAQPRPGVWPCCRWGAVSAAGTNCRNHQRGGEQSPAVPGRGSPLGDHRARLRAGGGSWGAKHRKQGRKRCRRPEAARLGVVGGVCSAGAGCARVGALRSPRCSFFSSAEGGGPPAPQAAPWAPEATALPWARGLGDAATPWALPRGFASPRWHSWLWPQVFVA